jgi:hypothetical protein
MKHLLMAGAAAVVGVSLMVEAGETGWYPQRGETGWYPQRGGGLLSVPDCNKFPDSPACRRNRGLDRERDADRRLPPPPPPPPPRPNGDSQRH